MRFYEECVRRQLYLNGADEDPSQQEPDSSRDASRA